MGADAYIPKRRLNNSHRLQLEKRLLEKHYTFLTCRIIGGVLFVYGSCRPGEYSITYAYKLKFVPGKPPKVYVTQPEIPYNDDIHLYADDNRLCLHFPNDYSWTDDSHLFDTIIPWTHEWFLFYELYLLTGDWQHLFVSQRKI